MEMRVADAPAVEAAVADRPVVVARPRNKKGQFISGTGEQSSQVDEKPVAKKLVAKKSAAKKPAAKKSVPAAKAVVRKRVAAKRTAPKRAASGARRVAGPEANEGRAEVVKKLLRKLEQKLASDDVKATLGDYIRLVQLQKELDEESPREIKVTWIEPGKTDESEAE
jgi:hypothetical protein